MLKSYNLSKTLKINKNDKLPDVIGYRSYIDLVVDVNLFGKLNKKSKLDYNPAIHTYNTVLYDIGQGRQSEEMISENDEWYALNSVSNILQKIL